MFLAAFGSACTISTSHDPPRVQQYSARGEWETDLCRGSEHEYGWPDPAKVAVVLYNGRDHYNGLVRAGCASKPRREWPCAVPSNARVLRTWMREFGVKPWASTARGYCGYESTHVSMQLLPAQVRERFWSQAREKNAELDLAQASMAGVAPH